MSTVYKNRSQYISPWVYPTLQNSWVSLASGYSDPRCRLEGNVVRLAGLCKSGTTTTGTTIFTLPDEMAPTYTQLLTGSTNNGIVTFVVTVDGNVNLHSTANAANISFDGLTFPLD